MRPALVWMTVAGLAGCRQVLGIDPVTVDNGIRDSGGGDTGATSDTVPSDAGNCYGPAGWSLCFATPPIGTPALTASINTTTSPLCQPVPASWTAAGQPDSCLILGDSIAVSTNVRATGSRPLILLAATTINVSATLDGSSNMYFSGSYTGPASNYPPCGTNMQPGDAQFGGGGGAGGSFASTGGAGGGGSGVNGGTACPAVTSHSLLRGGLAGEVGGQGQITGHAGGGSGGGAIYLVAGASISVSGTVNVSGGGGGGGTYYGGGGGGGAGGMLALYAPTIDAIGVVMANGGSGGTGGTNNASTGFGSNPLPSAPLVPAPGGTETDGRESGGQGCARGAPATPGGALASGGGGCGFILSNQPLSNASVSPGLSAF